MDNVPNFEYEIFDGLYKRLAAYDPACRVLSSPEDIPENLPCVICYESSNIVNENGVDSCEIENWIMLQYTVDIYTNDVNGKADRAKLLAREVAAQFNSVYGLYRIRGGPVHNYGNPAIYRYTMTFEGTINKNGVTLRR